MFNHLTVWVSARSDPGAQLPAGGCRADSTRERGRSRRREEAELDCEQGSASSCRPLRLNRSYAGMERLVLDPAQETPSPEHCCSGTRDQG